MQAGRDATLEGIEQRTTQLAESVAQTQEHLTAHLDQGLAARHHAAPGSVAELAQQVVEGRTDARAITEALNAIESRSSQSTAGAVAPLMAEIARVRSKVEAIPAPDLGPVAAQLARLSATIVSQVRHEAATAGDVAALGTALDSALKDALKGVNEVGEELRTAVQHRRRDLWPKSATTCAANRQRRRFDGKLRDDLRAQSATVEELAAHIASQPRVRARRRRARGTRADVHLLARGHRPPGGRRGRHPSGRRAPPERLALAARR